LLVGICNVDSAIHTLHPTDAILIVDVQVDFCPGGALPVVGGHDIVPVLNRWIESSFEGGAGVVASRDWHPREHLSFTTFGGLWPPHCIQDTYGARFHPDLRLPDTATIVSKGTRFDREQYSAFDGTGLATELRRRGIQRLWIGGLALDVCVRATALDAVREGFAVELLLDATCSLSPEGGEESLAAMAVGGVRVPGARA
jgi:nicotinamidase/pyrazinamidase